MLPEGEAGRWEGITARAGAGGQPQRVLKPLSQPLEPLVSIREHWRSSRVGTWAVWQQRNPRSLPRSRCTAGMGTGAKEPQNTEPTPAPAETRSQRLCLCKTSFRRGDVSGFSGLRAVCVQDATQMGASSAQHQNVSDCPNKAGHAPWERLWESEPCWRRAGTMEKLLGGWVPQKHGREDGGGFGGWAPWRQGRGHGGDFGELSPIEEGQGEVVGSWRTKWRMQWRDISFWYLGTNRQRHSDLQDLKHLQAAEPPKKSIFVFTVP